MNKPKLIRITTVPISLEKLLEGQLRFMSDFYNVTAISSDKKRLEKYGALESVAVKHVEFTRKITPLKDLISVYKLYKIFRKEKPLIVHTHTPKAGVSGMIAAYLARVPIRMHTVAGLPLMEATGIKKRILNIVEKTTYLCASKVYPNSRGLLDYIINNNFTDLDKLKIIGNGSSNGIDTSYFTSELYEDSFREQKRKEIGLPLENFVFVFVGRIVKDKGVNEMVAAFDKLARIRKNISLLLIGFLEEELDPLTPDTVKLMDSHLNIFNLGYQIDVRPYFVVSDALVFPSYREGFPNVVMQAGAMGLPSIVTNINGCNEIVSEGKNGVIIPSKDADALYGAMDLLVKNPERFDLMRNNSRIEITSKYERKDMFDALLKEYQELEDKL